MIWACTEPEITLCWINLGSSDNHYTTLPKILLKAISSTLIVRAVFLSLKKCFLICWEALFNWLVEKHWGSRWRTSRVFLVSPITMFHYLHNLSKFIDLFLFLLIWMRIFRTVKTIWFCKKTFTVMTQWPNNHYCQTLRPRYV